ncbi:MAG: nucleoside-diphosphate sugar epimerase/dehydratase [Paracoccaceae bacterium]|nr:nucleoside-diphosphate sugar epimerase/dehydratase [Paracoccaceae bacterium]
MDQLLRGISTLSRAKKTGIQIITDSMLLSLAFVFSGYFRLENFSLLGNMQALWAFVVSMITTLCAFYFLGIYSTFIRFLTGKILFSVIKGLMVGALSMYAASWLLEASIPRSIPIIFALVAFLALGGVRFAARTLLRNPEKSHKRHVIIYGAGVTGLQTLNSLFHGREYLPVAMVDDDPKLHSMVIGGLTVDSSSQMKRLLDETGARIVLLAMPSASRERRREIVNDLQHFPIEIKTIPGMSDIISGKANISELRHVSPEDLLGRDPVEPDSDLMEKNIQGRVVMVSGAGGSIGSELCRQILLQNPAKLVLYETSEFSLYSIDAELCETAKRLTSSTEVISVLGSVQHERRLAATLRAFKVDTIYHAAAYKHVPLVEENVVQGIRNNVFGTRAIVSAARKTGVENFILVSTDKAVRPTNIMGATKRLAELICQAQPHDGSSTKFSMVRFGNVLGSSGSVIPLFKKQIEAGGPITVTHREINRYFMTIPEASQLVIQSGAMAEGGDVFVLDMGEPVKILELAQSMVKLHGLIPYIIDEPGQINSGNGDVPICITGLRKGEKLFEELLIGNNPAPTQHPRIMTASEVSLDARDLERELERLLTACEAYDLEGVIKILSNLPLGYIPTDDAIFDNVWTALQEATAKSDAPNRETMAG